jgi:hypothetical protein
MTTEYVLDNGIRMRMRKFSKVRKSPILRHLATNKTMLLNIITV